VVGVGALVVVPVEEDGQALEDGSLIGVVVAAMTRGKQNIFQLLTIYVSTAYINYWTALLLHRWLTSVNQLSLVSLVMSGLGVLPLTSSLELSK